jgi:hypothetical protein
MKSAIHWLTLGAILAILAVSFACSDDDDDGDDSGGDSSATPSVCDQKESVDTAVSDLSDIDVLAEGTDALNAAVADVKTEVQELKAVVSSDVEPEVEAMETAVSDAEDTLSGISDDATLNEKIDDVQSALTGIATAGADLATALENEC